MIFAVVPAAGKSTRMGRPKLSLPLGTCTILERVIHALRQGGVDHVLVVAAPHVGELASLAQSAGAHALVLPDARVSRHHARLQGRRGALVLTDLGSTNGSRVNGVTVEEVVLGEGDRIQVGDTILIVESVPDG